MTAVATIADVGRTETLLVTQAIAARVAGEHSSWQEADCYAELSKRGWTQQRIAEQCKTKQQRVSRYIGCATLYALGSKRPSFWEAYSEVRPDKKDDMGVHYSSETDEWSTPPDLFAALDAEFHFDIDVCATFKNAKCKRFFVKANDALAQDWRGVCWMNPPYGSAIEAWIRKASEAAAGGATVVCLIPARTDTAWWWDYCRHGEIRFLRGRLKFGGAESGAPFPSAVVVFPRKSKVVWWEWQTA